jgi:DNA-binding transcriptional ArsR family regulator
MKCHSYNTFFETVGNKTRLDVIELLLKEKGLSVSDICAKLKEEQSKISHNLKILSDCHFLNVEKKGKQRIYALNKETIVPLMSLVEKHVVRYCCNNCKKVGK